MIDMALFLAAATVGKNRHIALVLTSWWLVPSATQPLKITHGAMPWLSMHSHVAQVL